MAKREIGHFEVEAAGMEASSDVFYQLGVSYAAGRTVERDLVTAHMWLNLAAHRGNAAAAGYRREISAEMAAEDIAAAQRAAREWLTRH